MSGAHGNTSTAVKPWIEVAALHPDVVSEHFSEDIFALDLGPLADGKQNVPAVYRDPEHFFRVSYLSKGLRSLLQDVLSRLSDGAGNRVLKLLTPFGGGKSHTLASLFHAARSRKALDVLPEAQDCQGPRTSTPRCSTASFSTQPRARRFPVKKSARKPCGAGLLGRWAARKVTRSCASRMKPASHRAQTRS